MDSPRQAWTRSNVVAFYTTHRNTPSDLYPSEIHFLSKVLRPGLKVLDVGCAAGGFCRILQEIEPTIVYTGVDISDVMIAEARRRHPEGRFEVSPADRLPFEAEAFDLVLCTGGTLAMILQWREVLLECWRVTRSRMLCDIRVVAEGPDLEDVSRSYAKLNFAGEWRHRVIVPYVVVTMPTLHRVVMALEPPPIELRGHGYFHAVSDMAVTEYQEVCMTMLCLGKDPAQRTFSWDVPVPWPGPEDRRV